MDSSVLLHLLVEAGFKPQLIHINHGLSPQAERWAAHAKQKAEYYQLACEVRCLSSRPSKGESLEAWARTARYEIFAECLREGGTLVLAHHLDDQAETFLLQGLRGAGPKGLSSMAIKKPFGKGFLFRPLLSLSREELQAYAVVHQLSWVEDESNQNLKFKRNVLRHEILPLLKTHFPGCLSTLSRSARLCAEETEVLNECVQEKLALLVERQTEGSHRFYFKREAFRLASPLLQRQLLRAWIFSISAQALNECHLKEIEKLLNAEHWGKSKFEVTANQVRLVFTREKEALFSFALISDGY